VAYNETLEITMNLEGIKQVARAATFVVRVFSAL
jgi:hypothetical protein